MIAPLCVAMTLAAAAFAGQAQEISVKANAPASAKPEKMFGVVIKVAVPDGHYIYANKLDSDLGIPTVVTIKAPAGVKVGAIRFPKPKTKELAGETLAYWDGEFTITVPVTAGKKNVGKNAISVEVKYQMCNDKICLPPQVAKASASTTVK
jgi:DsbC/DsbD-like thiol-disulfide interchange protein